MSRIVWLASYPKSGNTWLRLLLANLGTEAPVDINALPDLGGIASARHRFDDFMLFPSGLLTHEECDRLRPRLYEAIAGGERPDMEEGAAREAEMRFGDLRFIKTHDAWTHTTDGEPILGAGARAILIVRDPRDVAPSLAHHRGQTIDQSIRFMADPHAAFCGMTDRQHNQLRQQLPGWSGFNRSWLEQRAIPLHLLRYEDLHVDPLDAISRAFAFAGLAVAPVQVEKAAGFASFAALQAQEREKGFREAPTGRKGAFFRRGEAEAWREELTASQIARIEHDHGEMMDRLGYARGQLGLAATA